VSKTLRQAIVDAQGYRSPARDDTERRAKAWAISQFQGTTGFPAEVLDMTVDEIAGALRFAIIKADR